MRTATVAAAIAALALTMPASALAQSGGDETSAVAINTKDGSSVFKLAFSVRRVMNEVVDQQNAAVAYANCESCQTVAISFQLVLVMTDPSVITPENLAVAINEECTLCSTYAGAFQFVFGNGGRIRFTAEGSRELAEIRRELQRLRNAGLSTAEIEARTEELAGRLPQVIATEIVPVGNGGPRPVGDRRDDPPDHELEAPGEGPGGGAGAAEPPPPGQGSPTTTTPATTTTPTTTAPSEPPEPQPGSTPTTPTTTTTAP